MNPPTPVALTAAALAGTAVVASPVAVALSTLVLVALLIAATGCFLRWYVHLTPRRRADFLALIRAWRRR